MTSDKIDLSIIIVSWNTRDLLKECLKSLYKYTANITFEVIVVDNNSSDGSAHMVREIFPSVNLIENNFNAGFSKANNQAIRISRGRYIALLNPDTLLVEDVFSPLIKYADQHEELGAIGPKILDRDGKSVQYVCARRLPNLYYDLIDNLRLDKIAPKIFSGIYMSNWDHQSPRFIEALSGACMIIRRKIIFDIGLLDENLFMYADDIDLCKRILDSGWKIYYVPKISIIHYGGESSKLARSFVNIKQIESKYYYYSKHKGRSYAYLFFIEIFFINLFKYIWNKLFMHKSTQFKEIFEIYKNNLNWLLKQFFRRLTI